MALRRGYDIRFNGRKRLFLWARGFQHWRLGCIPGAWSKPVYNMGAH